jgi:colanic acid biosynthesis glycosyl transferase WcaI
VKKLKIILISHYFPPEVGAPQTRLYELARHAVQEGHQVTVVTGFPNYPTGIVSAGYRRRLVSEEDLEGIRVIRTWVYATPNRGFVRRILNHLSFALSSLVALPRVGAADVLFVESPPLFTGIAALAYSAIKHAPYVFNVSDIWPQSAVELGALRNPAAIRVAEGLEMNLYRRAAMVSVVVPGMLGRLTSRGVPEHKLALLTNGVDTNSIHPSPPNSELAHELGLDGHKIFLYAGTHGMAQGLDIVVRAAQITKDPDIRYLLVGEGAEKEALMRKVQAEGIANVQFLPNQPRRRIRDLLNLAYGALVPLRRLDLFRSALPSKMFEAMAASKPVIASVWGEAADLVETARCGLVVPPEDAVAMRDAVEKLAARRSLATELGENGRRYVLDHFDRRVIGDRFIKLLTVAAAKGR